MIITKLIFKNKKFKAINKNFNYNFITSKLITNDKKRIMKYKEEIIKHMREKINIRNSTISFFDHHIVMHIMLILLVLLEIKNVQ